MSSRLFLAPWWTQALLSGALFAVLTTTYALLEDHDGWVAAAVFGASSFVFFGAYTGWAGHRARSRWRTAVGLDLDDDQLLIVHRAMTTGPVPSDPRLRVAAVDAATYDLARLDGPWVGVAFMLLFPVVIVFRVYDSWWWALLVPLYLYGVHQVWVTPRRLRARIELLQREPAADQPGV